VAGDGQVSGTDDARRQPDECEIAAAVHGNVLQHLSLEGIPALGALRLELGDAARDGNGFRQRSDFEDDGPGVQFVVRVQHDVGALDGLETLQRDTQGIGSRLHLWKREGPGGRGRASEHIPALIVGEGNGRTGHRCGLGILDDTRDGTARRLRACRGAARDREDD